MRFWQALSHVPPRNLGCVESVRVRFVQRGCPRLELALDDGGVAFAPLRCSPTDAVGAAVRLADAVQHVGVPRPPISGLGFPGVLVDLDRGSLVDAAFVRSAQIARSRDACAFEVVLDGPGLPGGARASLPSRDLDSSLRTLRAHLPGVALSLAPDLVRERLYLESSQRAQHAWRLDPLTLRRVGPHRYVFFDGERALQAPLPEPSCAWFDPAQAQAMFEHPPRVRLEGEYPAGSLLAASLEAPDSLVSPVYAPSLALGVGAFTGVTAFSADARAQLCVTLASGFVVSALSPFPDDLGASRAHAERIMVAEQLACACTTITASKSLPIATAGLSGVADVPWTVPEVRPSRAPPKGRLPVASSPRER